MLVSVWTDSYNDSRDENLVQRRLRGRRFHRPIARRVVDGLDVFLLPNTKYWVRFENEVGEASAGLHKQRWRGFGWGYRVVDRRSNPTGLYSGSYPSRL